MNKVRKDFYVLFLICALLLTLGSFFDYEISGFIYNRSSIFGGIIHFFAQIPTYILLVFFSMGLFNTRSKDGSLNSMLSFLIGIVLAFVFGFLAGYVFLLNMDLYSITMTIATDIGIVVCCYVITKLICDHDAENLRKFSKVMIYSFIICIVLSFICISFLDRSPYRRLDGMVNVFNKWYQLKLYPNLTGYLHRSFPSLNMLMASFVLYINVFNSFARSFRKRKLIILVLGYCWVLAVAFSQLILGHAYISDIAISVLLQFIVSLVVFKIIYRKKRVEK